MMALHCFLEAATLTVPVPMAPMASRFLEPQMEPVEPPECERPFMTDDCGTMFSPAVPQQRTWHCLPMASEISMTLRFRPWPMSSGASMIWTSASRMAM